MPVADIQVAANTPITETAITLRTGQAASIEVAGQWDVWGNSSRTSFAEGNTPAVAHNRGTNEVYPVPGAAEGCLVVFLDGRPVEHIMPINRVGPVGSGVYKIVVTGPGRLGFGPNDDHLADNSGILQVRITI